MDVGGLKELPDDQFVAEIRRFFAENANATQFVPILGDTGKTEFVDLLAARILSNDLDVEGTKACLDCLRIFCRESAGMRGYFRPEVTNIVLDLAKDPTYRSEALKLLVNSAICDATFKSSLKTEEFFSFVTSFIEDSGNGPMDRGLFCRLLLHLTAYIDDFVKETCMTPQLSNSLCNFFEQCLGMPPSDAVQFALDENLKVMYNITRHVAQGYPPESNAEPQATAQEGTQDEQQQPAPQQQGATTPELTRGIEIYDRWLPCLVQCLLDPNQATSSKHYTANMLLNLPPNTPYSKLVTPDNVMQVLAALGDLLDKALLDSPDTQLAMITSLHVVVKTYPETREFFYNLIFPPIECGPDVEQSRTHDERSVEPSIDLPAGSLRQRIVANMTSLNFNLKHYSGEFLYLLCNEDISELVRVTGLGNAAGLMADKGLLGQGR
eukprot:c15259_g1_i1.p1 GENE.c15259_g1_i1~~c15259_g1_i1.p1  ORF type:complete len:438 (+),score=115.43 c15259_g1_i1:32-1345(+)